MDFEMIRAKIAERKYDHPKKAEFADYHQRLYNANHIFDENQTIIWNRNKAAEENLKLVALREEYEEIGKANPHNFDADVIAAIMSEYSLNEVQAKIVNARAWEDGHAYGYGDVLSHAISLGSMAEAIIEAIKEN